ncbi:hypothetical protein KSP40_PGU003878 [Platanthera guangdongensis]|uniref:RNase H type-1 domain-containing protein n=1 Tax=Platanthera guangdongensis TaxID=2320717 RepID=A0ABR2MYR0_9ASPA
MWTVHCLPSRCAGLGIVVRSEAGQVLMAASFAWQYWDPGRVELEAILAIRRVVLPIIPEDRGIIIEGDAANVLDFCSRAAWGSARPNTYPGAVDLTFLTEYRRMGVAEDFMWETGAGADETCLGLVAEDCPALRAADSLLLFFSCSSHVLSLSCTSLLF